MRLFFLTRLVSVALYAALARWDGAEIPQAVADLLEERLVACASILPGVESVYRWEGRVECGRETVLLMETAEDRVEAAIARLEAIHPYDVPKIVVIDPEAADPDYVSWLRREVRPAPGPRNP